MGETRKVNNVKEAEKEWKYEYIGKD
jgi:hypothetical protein